MLSVVDPYPGPGARPPRGPSSANRARTAAPSATCAAQAGSRGVFLPRWVRSPSGLRSTGFQSRPSASGSQQPAVGDRRRRRLGPPVRRRAGAASSGSSRDGKLLATPFLDITDRVTAGGERGLLGLAFPPGFGAARGRRLRALLGPGRQHDDRRFRLDPTTTPASDPRVRAVILLTEVQPYPNHNGGMVAFGPDGDLYVGMGDGGSGGDPQNNGQRLDTLLGKLLRIDVSGDRYTVRPGRPTRSCTEAARGRRSSTTACATRGAPASTTRRATSSSATWARTCGRRWTPCGPGARRPRLRLADLEGRHCYNATDLHPPRPDPARPEYSHAFGCAVIGGFVYRGTTIPR